MKLVVATAADYFGDVGLHRQLSVKTDPEITNGLQRTDHRGASIQRQIGVSKILHASGIDCFRVSYDGVEK